MTALKKIVFSAAMIALLVSYAVPAAGRTIHGSVFFRDSTVRPAAYVMVYAKKYNIGTMTGEDGRYTLRVPDCQQVHLEYAIMGWKNEYRNVSVQNNGATAAEDIYLEPQPIMLAAAYVATDGEPPSKYIMRQVWKKAAENKKRLKGYEASVTYDIASHGIPEVAGVLSWFKMGLLKMTADRFGYKPLLKHIIENEDFYAKAALERSVSGSRTRDTDNRILESDRPLPAKVQKNILSLFENVSLSGMLYGDSHNWGEKFTKSHTFDLVGTYQYGDRLVDILSWQDGNSGVKVTVHVVEEIWGLLRIEIGRKGEVISIEARDVGDNLFMPICFVVRPQLMLIRASEIPELIYDLENNRRLDKNMTRRTVEILKRHEGSDFNPYITVGYNVEYRKVNIAPAN